MGVAEAPSQAPVALPEATLLMVARGFASGAHARQRGEVVERSDFKTTRAMEACSMLLPVPHGVRITVCGCGRRWVSRDAASRHACSEPASESEPASDEAEAR